MLIQSTKNKAMKTVRSFLSVNLVARPSRLRVLAPSRCEHAHAGETPAELAGEDAYATPTVLITPMKIVRLCHPALSDSRLFPHRFPMSSNSDLGNMKPRITNLLFAALCSFAFAARLCGQGTA